jgi:hypothetical protein
MNSTVEIPCAFIKEPSDNEENFEDYKEVIKLIKNFKN